MIAWLILGLPAWGGADTYYAEVSLGRSSMGAMRVYQQLGGPGGSDRLVRRYRQGQGWEYFLLSGEVDSVAVAAERGTAWTAALERGVTIYQDGGVSGEVVVGAAEGPPPSAGILTARLSRTLGGRAGGLQQLGRAENIHFVYERSVEEQGVSYAMKHNFSRRGDHIDMTIEPLEDVGVGSRMTFDGKTAEVWSQGAAVEAVDVQGVSELLGGMGPSGVFAFVLELPQLLHTDPRYQGLELSESVERDGRVCGVLVATGSEGGVQLVVDPVDWWLVEASILGNMGLVTYRFGDWREIDTNLVLPFQAELLRDGRVLEKIRVLEVSLQSPDSQAEGRSTSLLNPLP